eukprot:gnl/TRDRNA2_/TRDRNA2_81866_c0_seq1.p1 gnl/TRDRNA2_/TRDRNA2_81866_c0~~gnl/TRDRNA2_/TRDRNA2_81866_c0_seq1.p1  ORF type:complete len:231 (-),score=52.32 gnl/TRDRNA2_/TRDRNA2_81866_c0_seq1:80-772(-)
MDAKVDVATFRDALRSDAEGRLQRLEELHREAEKVRRVPEDLDVDSELETARYGEAMDFDVLSPADVEGQLHKNVLAVVRAKQELESAAAKQCMDAQLRGLMASVEALAESVLSFKSVLETKADGRATDHCLRQLELVVRGKASNSSQANRGKSPGRGPSSTMSPTSAQCGQPTLPAPWSTRALKLKTDSLRSPARASSTRQPERRLPEQPAGAATTAELESPPSSSPAL